MTKGVLRLIGPESPLYILGLRNRPSLDQVISASAEVFAENLRWVQTQPRSN